MKDFAALAGALAWPLLIGGLVWFFRSYIVSSLDAARRQFSAGARLKWKDFEFEGVSLLDFNSAVVPGYRSEPATKEDLDRRHAKYAEQKNLFLVHRTVATGEMNKRANLPSYDILVKLVRHKHYGKLNDVKRVEYYLGKYFGRDSGHGIKYVVEDGSDGFAIRVDAYGPTLCEATLFFQDGTTAVCSRYLDFEGTGYQYDPTEVARADAPKPQRRRPRAIAKSGTP